MKNDKMGLGIFIGLLVAIILMLGGFIVYDKVLSKDNISDSNNANKNNNAKDDDANDASNANKDNINDSSNTNKDNNTKDNIVEENLSINDSTVKNLSSKVIGIYTNNMLSHYSDYFYKKNKITLADEDISFKLSLAAESVRSSFSVSNDAHNCNNGVCGISYIDEATIKDAYYNLFGSTGYSRATFYVADCVESDGYKWSSKNNRYEDNVVDGCGGTSFGGAISKLGYAKKISSSNETTIELYEYFAYQYSGNEDGEVNYYSDYNKTQLITSISIEKNYSKDEFFSKFSNKSGLYKYTFKKDKDGIYVFTSVEKVK